MAIAFSQDLDDLLKACTSELDIPIHLHELAVRRYEHLATALCGDHHSATGLDCEIYPQGSFRLGTVTRPIHPNTDYDIDLVCRRNISKTSTTQAELKAEVGKEVISYCNSEPEGLPSPRDGKRCWTLIFSTDPFHMDVLPAIPEGEGVPNAILLTDKELRNWQRSNPIDYAKWFHKVMEEEFFQVRQRLAKELKAADVEDVPPWRVKTTLQRSVQALKRHRDIYFITQPDLRPASIIITTLAARAYIGTGSLFEVLVDVSGKMPELVDRVEGAWVIPNPVQPKENFADRWMSHPEKADAFFSWIGQAHRDFRGYGQDQGIHKILERLSNTLGKGPAQKAGAAMGSALAGARAAGALSMSDGTGTLGTATGRQVREHTFHGDTFGDSS